MIYWEVLLGTEDVCNTLVRLYQEFKGVGPLAAHLGVSVITLRKKLKECNIVMLPRGGAHIRFDRNELPDNWWNLSTEQLTRLTGYTAYYIRKLRRDKLWQLGLPTKTKDRDYSSNIPQEKSCSDESEEE